MSNFDIKEAKRLYQQEQWSMKDIGEKYGISKQGVHYHFKKHGVKRRPGTQAGWQIDDQRLHEMHIDQKMSAQQIADQEGVSKSTVIKHLHRLGIFISAKIKREWVPCAVCGKEDGYIPPDSVTPLRCNGKPYGVDGMICHTCRCRLYRRKRRREAKSE